MGLSMSTGGADFRSFVAAVAPDDFAVTLEDFTGFNICRQIKKAFLMLR